MAGFFSRLFHRAGQQSLRCGAVVPAAGSSTRMGQDKLLLPLDGVPVLLRTLRALDDCPLIDEIVVVTREDLMVPISGLCRDAALSKVCRVVRGGDTRTKSVLAGLEELSRQARKRKAYRVKLQGLTFSLSGMENKVRQMAERGAGPAETAWFTQETVCRVVLACTQAAMERFPGLPVLCSGGVASNRLLRSAMADAVFAEPRYSTDNAMGTAILTWRALERGAEP